MSRLSFYLDSIKNKKKKKENDLFFDTKILNVIKSSISDSREG